MRLGLSETDVKVYVFLAKNGPHKNREIADTLKLSKEQLNSSLKSLRGKDVVKATIEALDEFSAVPFEEVIDSFINTKREQTQTLLENSKELISSWKAMIKKKTTTNLSESPA